MPPLDVLVFVDRTIEVSANASKVSNPLSETDTSYAIAPAIRGHASASESLLDRDAGMLRFTVGGAAGMVVLPVTTRPSANAMRSRYVEPRCSATSYLSNESS